jgi:hypothetical protein
VSALDLFHTPGQEHTSFVSPGPSFGLIETSGKWHARMNMTLLGGRTSHALI